MDMTLELAAFLRDRRERLAPADVGLPAPVRPRRTPGLRREEVAELAGVSVDYVVRLEQGRGLRPSVSVLDALARALRLSEYERSYLFDLAEQRPTPAPDAEPGAAGPLARLVGDLSPLPAMIIDHRFDILDWNREAVALMLDFGELPVHARNTIWMCLLHPSMRDFYRDRELVIREGVAGLRAACAAHPDDGPLNALVERLLVESDEFARMWALRDVRLNGRGLKRLAHRAVGPLTVEYEVLAPVEDQNRRLILYRAADPASQIALDALVRAPSSLGDPGTAPTVRGSNARVG